MAINLNQLNAIQDLKLIDKGHNKWASTGDDPQFAYKLGPFTHGWVLVTLHFKRPLHTWRKCSTCLPKLYLLIDDDYVETHMVRLPLNEKGYCKRIVYIPWKTRWVRFDPLESKGQFSIKMLSINPILPWNAYALLLKQLSRHPLYYRKTRLSILKLLKEQCKGQKISCKNLIIKHYNEMYTENFEKSTYNYWIENVEKPKLKNTIIKQRLQSLRKRPLISVILPTYKSNLGFLRACIESVLRQSYKHWELCIADDASAQKNLTLVLQKYAASYPKQIKLALREKNGHISEATNSALELASGDFVALLDHDDLLAPHALLAVAEKINSNNNVKIIYSDEDKISEKGERHSPYFKPAWNPELLRGQNYFCHLCVYERTFLNQLGCLKKGLEGAQDWDLALRATEQLNPSQIEHIPQILYHWRAISGSTALAVGEKNYILSASKKALENHFQRINIDVTISPTEGSHWRIKHKLPPNPPLVSLLIPTRNNIKILKSCLNGVLEKTDYPNYEIVLIDNNSDDPQTIEYLQSFADLNHVKVIRDRNPFNFSAINNRATNIAKGSLLAFLNDDIDPINSDWLSEMVSEALQPQTGAVGAMLYYPSNRVQHAGVVLGIAGPAEKNGVAGHAFKNFPRGHSGQMNRMCLRQNYSAVTAACLVVRRKVFEEVGGFNERDLPISFNDVDLCLRILEAGYQNLWTPFAELYHHESASRGTANTAAKRRQENLEITYMRKKWGESLDNDPAYNPNLTLINEDFSIGC